MEGLWVLAVLWVILSFVGKISKNRAGRAGQGPAPDPEVEIRRRHRLERARRSPEPERPTSATEQLEAWRREMERLTGLRTGSDYGPMGKTSAEGLPEAEDVEDRESLEVEGDSTSLEVSGERAARVVVDQDEQAEQLVRRRTAVAEGRLSGRSAADHRRFDQAIRAVPVQVVSAGRSRLRTAVIWREVLERPVSLRDGS